MCHEVIPAGIGSAPLPELPLSQEVLIIQPEFLEAGSGDVGQLDFHFAGGTTGLAALSNILHSTPGRLDHLVMGSAEAADIGIAESGSHIKTKLSDLEAFELFIASMSFNQRLPFHAVDSPTRMEGGNRPDWSNSGTGMLHD